MRRWLGIGFVVVGIVVLCLPFKYTWPSPAQPDEVVGSVVCIPIRDAPRQQPREILYLEDSDSPDRPASLPAVFCVHTARRRAVVGGMSLVAGTGVLLWERRRRRLLRSSEGHGP